MEKNKQTKLIKDLVLSKLVEKTELTKKVCETVYDALSDVILEGLMDKSIVVFGNLGQFKYKASAARECRSIKTGEKIKVPAKGTATFSLSKKAKESLLKIV